MKAAGEHHHSARGKAISLAVVVVGVLAAVYAEHQSVLSPETDDATIDADVVHVAPAVGGRIIKIAVTENAKVAKGDLLFQLDAVPYELALEQAQADLALAEASLDTRRRILSSERSNAVIASDQTRRALTNSELAARTVQRLAPLADQGYVPTQQLDQAQTAERDAATSLRQAQEQHVAAVHVIGTDADATATVLARQAAVAIAQRALDDTTVRASHDARVVGLAVSSGEMAAPAQSLFTLIDTEAWYAVANFRETALKAIAVGDCTTVYSMIDRRRAIRGTVEGIGTGVLDEERINLPRSVPYVERSLNWVRVAQRFPVRIRLHDPPEQLMRMGASAVVEVRHGAACR